MLMSSTAFAALPPLSKVSSLITSG